MNKNQNKNDFIKNLIAIQSTRTGSGKLSPKAFHIILAYLEQLEESCNAANAAAEQTNITQRVNTILGNHNICLSADTLTALRQMLPLYKSILDQFKHCWNTKEKEETLLTFETLLDYTIVYSEKLEMYGDFASPAAFPFPVIETARQIQLLTKENYVQETEKTLDALSDLTDYIQDALERPDKHMVMAANEIMLTLTSQTGYILKVFL